MHCNKDPSACCEARPIPYRPRNSLVQKARATGLYALFAATLLAVVTFGHFRIFRPASLFGNTEQGLKVETEWDWTKLPASDTLDWKACFDSEYECAKLDVPMDWLEPSEDARVQIAVLRLRAKNLDDYRGPIFVNPGGPGGPGTSFVLDRGHLIQDIVGDNHDIVSFDPRGVGASTPKIDCWGNPQRRYLWTSKEIDVINSHPGMIYDTFAQYSVLSQECERAMNESGLMAHLSTASHAHDMLRISQVMGYEKLKYWGFSYGTLLGGTFAGMFPDKVDRLVSDGNVEYEEWYNGTRVGANKDSEIVLQAFFHFCHKAGPAKCALYDNSEDAIAARFQNIINASRTRPVIVPASPDGPDTAEIVTYSRVMHLIFDNLYKPIASFPGFADIMAALETGDGLPWWKFRHPAGTKSGPDAFCAIEDPSKPPSREPWDDAFGAIMCADGGPVSSVDEIAHYAKEFSKLGNTTAAISLGYKLNCIGRQVRSRYRFTGPFEKNTSFPILFIGNSADNVTPLASARSNSEKFHNSVLLTQNCYGHTSLTAPSMCKARYVRAYFQDGSLPPPNTACDVEQEPFGDTPLLARGSDGMAAALHELSLARHGWRDQLCRSF